MSKLNSSHGFISLLYSIGDNPLGLWSKYVSSEGQVRRIEDESLNGDRVIEIKGPENSQIITNISCPANPLDCLNIQLPILVIILKNLKARLQIAFQLIDDEDIRRKFILTTSQTSGRGTNVEPETARLNLVLDDDWNNLEIDMRSLCQSIYRTDFRALQRLVVYQNCRVRRIYLQDRHYDNHETPVELCQAFFDMYMLKWGINFVEKSCQTIISYVNTKNDETNSSSTRISRIQRDGNSSSTNEPSTLPSDDEKSALRQDSTIEVEKREKTLRSAIARKKFIANGKETTSHGKIASMPIGMEKLVKNKDIREGEIFRKWPYNYLKYQQIGEQSVSTSMKNDVDTTNASTRKMKISIVDRMKISPIGKIEKIEKTTIDAPIMAPEVEAAAAETSKIVESTRSKILSTDEAVGDYLELRHIVNRKILENFRSRGLTMTEVELSIYNSKHRRNSYGQGKLVHKHRRKIDKACAIVDAETKKRENSAISTLK